MVWGLLCAGSIVTVTHPALAQEGRSVASRSLTPGSGGAGLGTPSTGADGGSAATGTSPAGSSGANAQAPIPTPANFIESASGDGLTVQTRASALLRHGLRFIGTIDGVGAREIVEIQRRGRATHWRWVATASTTVSSTGRFATVWRTDQAGIFQIRAVALPAPAVGAEFARPALARARHARASAARTPRRAHAGQTRQGRRTVAPAPASPPVAVTVYRPGFATIYGPGLYGRHTACGERLRRSTIGVANRTLPCGTEVSLYYHGRALVVPVIDRGPYANGADWDLTVATAGALGMRANSWVGAIALPRSAITIPAG